MQDWIEECDSQIPGVFVLRARHTLLSGDGEKRDFMSDNISCMIFVYTTLHVNEDDVAGLIASVDVDSQTLNLRYETAYSDNGEFVDGYELSEVQIFEESIRAIDIYIDGARVNYSYAE